MTTHVSLICTVLNESQTIHKLLNSIAEQSRLPDEIVIVDGGSTDNTVALIQAFAERHGLPLQLIHAPGANISRGRNLAIDAAAGPIVASTDAGVRLDDGWLDALCQPFETNASAKVVSGFFVPDCTSTFEVAMGATVLPILADIDPLTFLPSSRSIAFLKSAWQQAGQYPEWLDFCEDLIFDFRLRDLTGPFLFAPTAVAYFRPRSSLRAFFKQYYQYARGDGKADLWRKRHAIRYFTYLAAVPLLLTLGLLGSPWWWSLGLLGAVGMFATAYRRLPLLWGDLPLVEKIKAAMWIPVIRISGDVAKMVGYPVGLQWRLARIAHQPELRWRSQ